MDNNPKYKITKIKALLIFQCYRILIFLPCISYAYLNELFLLPKWNVYQALLVSFIERNVECAYFFAKIVNCANDRNLKGFAGFIKLKADEVGIASLLETKRIHNFIV